MWTRKCTNMCQQAWQAPNLASETATCRLVIMYYPVTCKRGHAFRPLAVDIGVARLFRLPCVSAVVFG